MSLIPIIVTGVLIALVAFVVERQINRRKRVRPPEALKVWGQRELKVDAAKRWLAGLDEREAKRLVRELVRFGRKGDFNIQMLLNDDYDCDEMLKAKVNAMAAHYVMARWQLADMQPELAANKLFLQIKQAPNRRKYRALVLDLYAQLIEAQLIPTPPVGETVRLSDRKKRKQAIEAIIQSAETNRAAFNAELIGLIESQKGAKSGMRSRVRPAVTVAPQA